MAAKVAEVGAVKAARGGEVQRGSTDIINRSTYLVVNFEMKISASKISASKISASMPPYLKNGCGKTQNFCISIFLKENPVHSAGNNNNNNNNNNRRSTALPSLLKDRRSGAKLSRVSSMRSLKHQAAAAAAASDRPGWINELNNIMQLWRKNLTQLQGLRRGKRGLFLYHFRSSSLSELS